MIAKYQADFPPENVTPPSLAHKTVHENLEVIQTAVISDRNAYDMELQRHIKASEEHEQKTIREYIQNRVAFLVSELDDDLPSKLKVEFDPRAQAQARALQPGIRWAIELAGNQDAPSELLCWLWRWSFQDKSLGDRFFLSPVSLWRSPVSISSAIGLETAIHTYEEIRAHEPQQENQDKSLIIVTRKACDWHVLCLNFLMYCDMHASLVIASCVGDVSCFSARRWTC